MRKNRFTVFISFLFLSLNSCILHEHSSWDFLQKAQLKINAPYKNGNEYYLPFIYDLNRANSAPLAIIKPKIKIRNNEIGFYLMHTLGSSNINEIKLGKLNSGIYKLYYIDRNKERIFIEDIIIE